MRYNSRNGRHVCVYVILRYPREHYSCLTDAAEEPEVSSEPRDPYRVVTIADRTKGHAVMNVDDVSPLFRHAEQNADRHIL